MCGDDGVLSWFLHQKLLEFVEFKLKEVISRKPTLLVLVIGVPNVGKSSLIYLIHQIVSSCFPGKLLLCFCWIMVGCHCLEMELWWRLLNYWTIKSSVFFHSAGEYEATLGRCLVLLKILLDTRSRDSFYLFIYLWFTYLIK